MKNNILNELKFTVYSRSNNESFARVAVSAFVAQLDPTIDEITDIKTAVSEAVTNCIVHAYPDKLGKIHITVQILDDGLVKIQVKDSGVGIENIKQALEPMYSSVGGERAGLGFAVMQSFMNKLSVYSKSGKGTTVTMEKYISVVRCSFKQESLTSVGQIKI